MPSRWASATTLIIAARQCNTPEISSTSRLSSRTSTLPSQLSRQSQLCYCACQNDLEVSFQRYDRVAVGAIVGQTATDQLRAGPPQESRAGQVAFDDRAAAVECVVCHHRRQFACPPSLTAQSCASTCCCNFGAGCIVWMSHRSDAATRFDRRQACAAAIEAAGKRDANHGGGGRKCAQQCGIADLPPAGDRFPSVRAIRSLCHIPGSGDDRRVQCIGAGRCNGCSVG